MVKVIVINTNGNISQENITLTSKEKENDFAKLIKSRSQKTKEKIQSPYVKMIDSGKHPISTSFL